MLSFGSTVPLSFHDALIAAMRRDLQAERQRFDALLDKYHALRVSGANPETVHGIAPKAEPDPVTQAIIKKAGNSLYLRKHYSEYARAERAANVAEAVIAQAILDGQSLTDEGTPA